MLDELRSNTRLRGGLAIAAALLAVTLLLDAQVALRDKRAALARQKASLAEMAQQAERGVWLERADAAQAARKRLESGLPAAPDAGVAEADFVDWMNRQLKQAGVGQANVVSAIPAGVRSGLPAVPDGTVYLRLNVSFEFVPGIIERLLEQLYGTGRFIVVEGLSLRRRPTQRLELIVSTVARIEGAGEPGARR